MKRPHIKYTAKTLHVTKLVKGIRYRCIPFDNRTNKFIMSYTVAKMKMDNADIVEALAWETYMTYIEEGHNEQEMHFNTFETHDGSRIYTHQDHNGYVEASENILHAVTEFENRAEKEQAVVLSHTPETLSLRNREEFLGRAMTLYKHFKDMEKAAKGKALQDKEDKNIFDF